MVACGFSECLISQTYLPPTIFLWPHHVWNSTIDTTIINTTSLWSKRAESRGYWSPFVLPGEPRGWEQTCRASLPLSHGLGTWTTVHHTHRLPDLGSASLSGDVQTVGNCRDLKSGFKIKTPPVWSDNTETQKYPGKSWESVNENCQAPSASRLDLSKREKGWEGWGWTFTGYLLCAGWFPYTISFNRHNMGKRKYDFPQWQVRKLRQTCPKVHSW